MGNMTHEDAPEQALLPQPYHYHAPDGTMVQKFLGSLNVMDYGKGAETCSIVMECLDSAAANHNEVSPTRQAARERVIMDKDHHENDREYEQRHGMRTRDPNLKWERPCSNMSECRGNQQFPGKNGELGDVLVEFYQPEVRAMLMKNPEKIDEIPHGMCLRCLRYSVGYMLWKIKQSGNKVGHKTVLCNFHNMTCEGQYLWEDCHFSGRRDPPVQPVPVVAEKDRYITRRKIDGIVYHVMSGYAYPDPGTADFV